MTSRIFRLDGKVAVVTGSSKGIGRAIATQLARAGARVVISSRKSEACEEVRKGLEAEKLQAIAIPCNAGRKSELENLIKRTLDTYGRIDICVANAAVNPFFGSLEELKDETWDKVMTVNLRAVFWLANMALPHIAASGDGTFLAVSSIGALRSERGLAAYNISKLALIGLVQNLAVEWGPKGVRANAIAPGFVRTDFARALWENPELMRRIETRIPLGRIGEPDDIAGTAVFLSSSAARFITGQTIVADGGATIVGAVD
jgi:NAD(P)-dependent dehydrogenase (short-subunit alcohol dehydrogenase family)